MAQAGSNTATFTNPVYNCPFPDPFVLKHRGEYFAYCTGVAPDNRVFPMLRSRDLVTWKELRGAMQPLEHPHPHYWAPEVTYHNGKFYLYYSVGNETLMEIRVAVANEPDGDYIDMGRRLTSHDFAIDPHVVRENNGQWHMFYATDFLDHSHIGTGTVVDRMSDPFTLAGEPRPVTRARYDWQVYDPARKEKGSVRWHTVEGPFVLKRKGLYYEMFSGGNWQNETYGVSFAVSETLKRDEEWVQFSDGRTTLPVLRTIPSRVLGPGHNSVVRGPNNRELYCIYHRWDEAGRVLAIDRMDFAGAGRLFVNGPTDTPQPVPFLPERISGLTEGNWKVVSGQWDDADSRLTSRGIGIDEIRYETGLISDYRCEIGFRTLENKGILGVQLKSVEIDLFNFWIDSDGRTASAEWFGSGGKRVLQLPDDFNPTADHVLGLDVEHETVNIDLDGGDLSISADLPIKPSALSLLSDGVRAEFGPVDITYGFEELFQVGDIWKRGWDPYANRGTLSMSGSLLRIEGSGAHNGVVTRNVEPGNYELCINLRISGMDGPPEGNVTFGCGNMFTLTAGAEPTLDTTGNILKLPDDYDPTVFSQFRIIRIGGGVDVFLESVHVGSVPAKDGEYIRITVQDAEVELDMVRYTLI
ncbi:hypothetical protein BH20ACI2_BH20ACI2_22860 [soil metagenome]